jgi:hypothetical protein
MQIKLEVTAPAAAARDVGEEFLGWPIVATTPGDPNMIVDVPDDQVPAALDSLQASGVIVDWRKAHDDYEVRWIPPQPGVMALHTPEEARSLAGNTEDVRRACKYGAGVAVYVFDTGMIPGRAGWTAKQVRWLDPSGGGPRDPVGHGHWCISKIAGEDPYGHAPDADATMVMALPAAGGSGTEADVANAFRMAADDAAARGLRWWVGSASLGGSHSSVINGGVAYAAARGMLLFAAAGNSGPSAPVGSPADAPEAYRVVGAAGWNDELMSFSSSATRAPVNVFALGDHSPGANKDSGNNGEGDVDPSGTSMATPDDAGQAVLLFAYGMGPAQVLAYQQAQGRKPNWANGQVIVQMGDGLTDAPVDPDPQPDDSARQHLDWAKENLDGALAEFDNAKKATSVAKARPFIAAGVKGLGDVRIELDAVGDRLVEVRPNPDPPPEPPPTARKIMVVCGTYPGHDRAKDGYAGYTDDQVQWGPHHNIPIVLPCDCNVSVLSLPTPLAVWKMWRTAEDMPFTWAEVERFLTNWTCQAPRDVPDVVTDSYDPMQAMYVAVIDPVSSYMTSGGPIRRLVGAHVNSAIKSGRQPKGTTITVTWDTGIRFEPSPNPVARAAHFHSAPSQSGQLLPNGDMDGIYGFEMLGWEARDLGSMPGPTDYSRPNLFCAGRRYQDFVSAGRQIPPIPS